MPIVFEKKKDINFSEIKKILLIKLRGIGDVLLSTPVIENLRKRFPDAQIDFLTEPPSKDIISDNPFLSNSLIFGRYQKGVLKFILDLRKAKYDLIIDLFGNPRSAIMTFLANSKYRVGYSYRNRRYAYNILLKSESDLLHNIDFNLYVLKALDIPVNDRNLNIFIKEKDKIFAEKFFKDNFSNANLVIGINAGGGWETRMWGFHKFAELSDRLIENFGAKILLFWGPGEEYIYQRIRESMHYEPVIAPITNLKEMSALYRRCSFVVSNNSGPMHIADASGTPILGIFGPTSPFHQGPVGKDCITMVKEGLDCLGCSLLKCPIGNICMTGLSVDEVYNKIVTWKNLKNE
jgi:heptosyltransferase III